MPMCVALVRKIQQVTEMDNIEQSATHPLLSLIVHHASEGKLESGNNKGLFVVSLKEKFYLVVFVNLYIFQTLPDQNHCYFMTENKSMEGVLVSSIPFTYPSHVSQILLLLRQQALFNTIISSCVRPDSRQGKKTKEVINIGKFEYSFGYLKVILSYPFK